MEDGGSAAGTGGRQELQGGLPQRLTAVPGATCFLWWRNQLLKSMQARHGFLGVSSASPCGTAKEKAPPSVPGKGS